MLKIKKNVNLKKLEKYGFKDEGYCCSYEEPGTMNSIEVLYFDRHIDITKEEGNREIDYILYSIITDGLVEWVEEQ